MRLLQEDELKTKKWMTIKAVRKREEKMEKLKEKERDRGCPSLFP